MKNLTVTLPEDVLARLRVAAAEKRLSMNRFVRQALADAVGGSSDGWRQQHEALRRQIGTRVRSEPWSRGATYAGRVS